MKITEKVLLEGRAASCREPLETTREAREVFAVRQKKMIASHKWPYTHWCNNEEFCRAFNMVIKQADEIERLHHIISFFEAEAGGDEATADWEHCDVKFRSWFHAKVAASHRGQTAADAAGGEL